MKRIVFALLVLSACFSCTKTDISPDNKEIKIVEAEQGSSQSESTVATSMDDDAKKFNARICSTNPRNLGTACDVIGNQCKSSDCSVIATDRLGSNKLSSDEITIYAQKHVELLQQKGLVDAENISYFKNLITQGLRDRNKTLK